METWRVQDIRCHITETGLLIKVMMTIGKILDLEGLIYSAGLELELRSSLWTPLNDIRKDIEGFAVPDFEYEKYLVKYVKANQSEFCSGIELDD